MPSQISNARYGQAILESVQSGTYSDSEEIVASKLPSSALATIINLVENASEDVRRTIRGISRNCAPDIDGWISQAKQLRNDIENSQDFAQYLLGQAKHGEQLQTETDDAAKQMDLLAVENIFYGKLVQILENMRTVQRVLGKTEQAIQMDQFEEAVELLCTAEDLLSVMQECQDTRVTGLLQANVSAVRHDLEGSLVECWNSAFRIDLSSSKIFIQNQIQRSFQLRVSIVVDALSKINLLRRYVTILYEQIDKLILLPRLKVQDGRTVGSLQIEVDGIRVYGKTSDITLQSLFRDLNLLVNFLRVHLPNSVSTLLAAQLMPRLIGLLISDWLSLQVPIAIGETSKLQEVLTSVTHFADMLESLGWRGKDELIEWSRQIPNTWLNKRKEITLDSVRKLLAGGLGESERVERVEVQMLSDKDNLYKSKSGDEEWDAGWCDEEGDPRGLPKPPVSTEAPEAPEADTAENEEDQDVSAWGLDDENSDDIQRETPTISDTGNDEGDENDAWGWGDDNKEIEVPLPVEDTDSGREKSKINGHQDRPNRATREVRLKETYNITTIPKEILKIIADLIADAQTLRSPGYEKSPIVSATGALLSLPGLVLSMYRASAPIYYSANPSGSMFLYNDSLWLAENLRNITGVQSNRMSQINVGAAEIEISALESFSKRTYGKEMESQRTIIGDLLDGAQGFTHCTEPPFSQECDIAVSSTVERLRKVHAQWKEVLSYSALLQSLGSLLSTVVSKIIIDIEDMSDISEPESQRLAGFCNRVAALEDLFTPENSLSDAIEVPHVPLTAVYTPNWLKFQYLANILESSLVDIKYLWVEGELKLEFGAEELVDLVEALFADSEHRRKAIGDIRKASIGQ